MRVLFFVYFLPVVEYNIPIVQELRKEYINTDMLFVLYRIVVVFEQPVLFNTETTGCCKGKVSVAGFLGR